MCFFIAVSAELAGYKYGERNDELSEVVIRSLAATASQAATDSGTAITNSGIAETTANGAEAKADASNKLASEAGTKAGEAKDEAAAVATKTAELDKGLTTASAQLAAVEEKRAVLEKSLANMAICNAPRVIFPWSSAGKTYLDPLLPMAGQKVLIEYVSDNEARHAAINLALALKNAKWDVQTPLLAVSDDLREGVSVQPSNSQTGNPGRAMGAIFMSRTANDRADELVKFLHSYNWQANRGWPVGPDNRSIEDANIIPEGAIRIQVGLKPLMSFLDPPAVQDLQANVKQIIEAERADLKRRRDQQASRLPPADRDAFLRRTEKTDAEMLTMSTGNPCQTERPLNPLF